MNMEHVKALAGGGRNRCTVHDGIALWSEGHVMGQATVEGANDTPSMAKKWDEMAQRKDEQLMELGVLYKFEKYVYRELKSPRLRLLMDEAYRRTVQDDHGIRIYAGSDQKQPITFRRDGELVGVVMPVRFESTDTLAELPENTSDETVFAHLACSDNDWYLQGPEGLRKKLREALAE